MDTPNPTPASLQDIDYTSLTSPVTLADMRAIGANKSIIPKGSFSLSTGALIAILASFGAIMALPVCDDQWLQLSGAKPKPFVQRTSISPAYWHSLLCEQRAIHHSTVSRRQWV